MGTTTLASRMAQVVVSIVPSSARELLRLREVVLWDADVVSVGLTGLKDSGGEQPGGISL